MTDDEAYEFYANPENLQITGPGRKRQGQRLTSMTAVRFAPEVIEAVKNRAFGEGVTVGSWIRRLVDREITEPRVLEMTLDGEDQPVRLPADALNEVIAALMPMLAKHGPLDLRIGVPQWFVGEHTATTRTTVSAGPPGRPTGLIEGSGRMGDRRSLGTSLSGTGRTFSCPHLSIGNVTHVSCGVCGPLPAVAA
jgi:hypothetical protein